MRRLFHFDLVFILDKFHRMGWIQRVIVITYLVILASPLVSGTPAGNDLENRINKTAVSQSIYTEGVYLFSGKIVGFPDSTAVVENATLTFKSPEGVSYGPFYTDSFGNFKTLIDTYVKDDDIRTGKASATVPVLNPTKDRSGFYMRVPDNKTVSLKAYNIRGQDITEQVLKNRIEDNAGDIYFQETDFSDLPSGVYLVNVRIGDEYKTIKFSHVNGARSYAGIHSAPSDNSGAWQSMKKTAHRADGLWELKIEHPDFQTRKLLLNAKQGSNSLDLDLVDRNWDMDFFDEITYRGKTGGTERWKKPPKLLIIDGPVQGYDNFLEPTQAEIDTLIKVWKSYQENTNGFISIPDSNIYITHDINNEYFKDAISQIIDGAVAPDTTNGKRYDISLWTDKVNTGDHFEWVENGEIKGAVQRYATGFAGAPTMREESSQSLGFANDPLDERKRFNYDGTFTELYKQCMRFNYSRPKKTFSPDTATEPIN